MQLMNQWKFYNFY